jgi:hypothetical protein
MARVRALSLAQNKCGTEGGKALSRWPGLSALTSLSLSYNWMGVLGARALLERAGSLQVLHAGENNYGLEPVRAVAAGACPRLRCAALRRGRRGRRCSSLATCPASRTLEELAWGARRSTSALPRRSRRCRCWGVRASPSVGPRLQPRRCSRGGSVRTCGRGATAVSGRATPGRHDGSRGAGLRRARVDDARAARRRPDRAALPGRHEGRGRAGAVVGARRAAGGSVLAARRAHAAARSRRASRERWAAGPRTPPSGAPSPGPSRRSSRPSRRAPPERGERRAAPPPEGDRDRGRRRCSPPRSRRASRRRAPPTSGRSPPFGAPSSTRPPRS